MKREKKYKTIIYYTLHRNLMTEQHEKKEHKTKGELMCSALTATLMQFVQKTSITHACVPGKVYIILT